MLTFNVEKMMCGGCVSAVEAALKALEGVEQVEVDLEAKQARVTGAVDPQAVIAALETAGYPARLAQ